MNWDALAAIAELLGALAVILTLGYLAIQVKQNTQGMKVAVKVELTKQFIEYTDLILKDSELWTLQLKGMEGQGLGRSEAEKFSLLMQRMTWHFSSMHFQYKAQSISEDDWYESRRLIKYLTSLPGYRLWWKDNAINFSVDFRNYLAESFESK